MIGLIICTIVGSIAGLAYLTNSWLGVAIVGSIAGLAYLTNSWRGVALVIAVMSYALAGVGLAVCLSAFPRI